MRKRIFVLEDETAWRDFILDALRSLGDVEVCHFSDCTGLKARLRRDEPDLLVLDWNLPDGTGLSMVRIVREEFKSNVPAIILTSRDSESDVIKALQMGADDFVTKPVSAAILAARSEALLRRSASAIERSREAETISGVTFDLKHKTICLTGNEGEGAGTPDALLTAKEFDLALLLFRAIGSPVSREAIYAKIWHTEPSVQSRTLDVHVTQIRRKLNLRPEAGFRLSTVYGFGYRLESLRAA